MPRPQRKRFVVEVDGERIEGSGTFVGPMTQADRDAIADIVRELKRRSGANTVQSVTLTKP